jgi:[ribosomal protein S18]-alanine N-acetyltransferase
MIRPRDMLSTMEEVEIRRATAEDCDWTAGVLAASEPWVTLGATLEKCRASCRDPEYHVYVARRERTRCGALVLHPRGLASSPYIKSIVVAEEFRGCGIGALLMDFAEDLARTGSRHIFLCVSSFNTRARRFYERRGYRAVGQLDDYVIDGASETILCKKLR